MLILFEGLPLKSAELYDPATGGWLFTGSFKLIQGSHSATLLPNGSVLSVAYSRDDNDSVFTAELYDPATGTWRITDPPNNGGGVASTILLPNGKVLVTGLSNCPCPLRVELFDPNTEVWTAADGPIADLFSPSYQTTLLPNGQVLLARGYSSHSRPKGEALYDPATGRWDFTGRLNLARHFPTATLLSDGNVLVAGGVDEGSDAYNFPHSEGELYNSATGPIAIPRITGASISGKRLLVVGENFDQKAQ